MEERRNPPYVLKAGHCKRIEVVLWCEHSTLQILTCALDLSEYFLSATLLVLGVQKNKKRGQRNSFRTLYAGPLLFSFSLDV